MVTAQPAPRAPQPLIPRMSRIILKLLILID
jgi:hypothetical protein